MTQASNVHFARLLTKPLASAEASTSTFTCAPTRGFKTSTSAHAAIGLPTLGETGLKLNSSKYTSCATEGVSVFDMKGAFETLKKGPDDMARRRAHPAAVLHAERVARAQQMGASLWGFKLFPDLTPGRAFMWGSLLAAYAVGAAAVLTCRSLDIHSVDEIKPKVHAYLAPYKAHIQTAASNAREAVELKERSPMIGQLQMFGHSMKQTFVGHSPAVIELQTSAR